MRMLVGLFAVVLGASTTLAQQITLRSAIQPGMSWSFETTQDMASDNKAMAMGQTHPFQSKQFSRRAGTVTVTQARNGEATQMKIAFTEKCESWGEMAGQRQNMPFPFAGRTVTVTRDEGGRVTTDVDGQADPMAIAELHGMIEPETVFMPKKPVSIGDEWEADPQGLSRQLQLQTREDSAGMTLKLLSVKNDARPTAEVKVSLAVIRNLQGVNTKLISQGTALVDIASGHIIKIDSAGTTTSKGTMTDQTPDGQQVQFQVEGQGKLTTTSSTPFINAGTVVAPPPTPVANDGGNPLAQDGGNPLARDGGNNPLAKKPAPFAGSFSDGKLTLDLTGTATSYTGTITLGQDKFPATATGNETSITGSFTVGGNKFPFTATLDGGAVTLVSEGTTYKLTKAAPKNPLAR